MAGAQEAEKERQGILDAHRHEECGVAHRSKRAFFNSLLITIGPGKQKCPQTYHGCAEGKEHRSIDERRKF